MVIATLLALSACGRLYGFEDFTAAGTTGAAGGSGASGSGGSGGSLPGWSSSCFDNEQNGDESDVDCGGSCPRCARDKVCLSNDDCWNGDCLTAHLCSGSCPPKMAAFKTVDQETFCIDTYEVTQEQYQLFLATGPSLGRQPPPCAAFNDSFAPRTTPGGLDEGHADCTANSFLPTDPDFRQKPVVCVDWCDAVAYCLDHGKFLCGSAATPDQSLDSLGFLDFPGDDAFLTACTSGDENNRYPYGDDYAPKTCNGLNYAENIPSLVDVGQTPSCVSSNSSSKAYNLVGNAAEWSTQCKTSTNQCSVRGGSFLDGESGTCDHAVPVNKADAFADVGFRCCG